MRQQLGVVAVPVRNAERIARPGELLGHRAAGGDELRADDASREIRRMVPAHAADAGDADAQRAKSSFDASGSGASLDGA